LLVIVAAYKKNETLLWRYALTGFLFDVVTGIFLFHSNIKFPLFNLFAWIEFFFVTRFYSQELGSNFKQVFWITCASAGAIILYSLFTFKTNILKFNSVGLSAFYVCYILYSILGFFRIIKEQKVLFLERSQFFWLNTAWLIYPAGVLFIFLFEDYYNSHHKKEIDNIWILVCILNIIKYIFIAIGFNSKEK
jgi:hypothetical protein